MSATSAPATLPAAPPAALAQAAAAQAVGRPRAEAAGTPLALALDARRLLGAVAATAVLLVAAHVIALAASGGVAIDAAPGYLRMFHLDGERNLPALFSAALLLANGALFAAWGGRGFGGGQARRLWPLIGLVFVFLAGDELFSVHERLGRPLREALHLTGALHHAWVLPYSALVAALAIAVLPIYLRLPRAVQARLAGAAVVYVGGALGMEMVAGALVSGAGGARDSLTWHLCVIAEEALELAGQVLLMGALLQPLAAGPGTVLRVTLVGRPRAAAR